MSYLAALVPSRDGHKIHDGHRCRFAEQRDDEATPVVFAWPVHVLDLDVKPRLVSDGVVTSARDRCQGDENEGKQFKLHGASVGAASS